MNKIKEYTQRAVFVLLLALLPGVRAVADDIKDVLSVTPIDLQAADSAVAVLEHNRLVFPAGRQYYDTLYARLQDLSASESARLRVLHIGGSHVQAGTFSGQMRSNLQAFSPFHAAGRGVMFPFSVMGTNGPRDCTYQSTGSWERSRNIEASPSYTLGLAGAALTTSNLSSTITFSYQVPFESVLLYGESLRDTAQVIPVLIADGDTIYPPRSSEEVGYEFLLPKPVTSCTLALTGDSCGMFTFRGVIPDPYTDGLVYTESGINGAAVPSWLRCEEFERELQPLAPDLVLFAIGINDANVTNFSAEQFKENYRSLIARIRRCNPHCALLFITNNDCYLRVGRKKRTFNKNTALVEKAFMELAEEYDGAVWNVYQIMGGYGSSNKWVRAGLMQSDHIHFTQRGYILLGDMLFNALLEDYNKWGPHLLIDN